MVSSAVTAAMPVGRPPDGGGRRARGSPSPARRAAARASRAQHLAPGLGAQLRRRGHPAGRPAQQRGLDLGADRRRPRSGRPCPASSTGARGAAPRPRAPPACPAAGAPGSATASSSVSAASAVIDSATISSCAAHSLTGRSTSGRAAHRSALIAPGSPCARSAVAGRVAANSATARARMAVCRPISRSAACTAPSGPSDSATGGANSGSSVDACAAAAPRPCARARRHAVAYQSLAVFAVARVRSYVRTRSDGKRKRAGRVGRSQISPEAVAPRAGRRARSAGRRRPRPGWSR